MKPITSRDIAKIKQNAQFSGWESSCVDQKNTQWYFLNGSLYLEGGWPWVGPDVDGFGIALEPDWGGIAEQVTHVIIDIKYRGACLHNLEHVSSMYLTSKVVDQNLFRLLPRSVEWVEIDSANPWFVSVDGVVFSKDKKRLICVPPGRKGSYSIPEGTVILGWDRFAHIFSDSQLSELKIPSSVQLIAKYAFDNTKIGSVMVDEGNPVYTASNGILSKKETGQQIYIWKSEDKSGRS